MYQCRECNTRIEKAALIYDGYDRELYPRCPCCGGNLEREGAGCCLCGALLFSGDNAIEAGDNIYCTECVVTVVI